MQIGLHEEDESFDWGSLFYWVSVYGAAMTVVCSVDLYSRDGTDDEVLESDVPENLWALNLIAAVGQSTYGSHSVSAVAITLLSTVMGCLQLFVLFLVVHDIDPNADPVTSKPSSPWVKSTWSVNCMKWVMVTFLGVFMVREAGDCRMLIEAIIHTNKRRLSEPKFLLFFSAGFQYLILIMIIWGGVTAVLSFQAVPDILYSSMSITFIAKVDEAFFTMVSQIFDLEAEFTIVHHTYNTNPDDPAKTSGTGSRQASGTYDFLESANDSEVEGAALGGRSMTSGEDTLQGSPMPKAAHALLRFMVILPVVLAVALCVRAFHTNVMPSERLHAFQDWLSHSLRR